MTQTVASLIGQVIDCLAQDGGKLSIREIARRLLNARTVTQMTLEALTERIRLALSVEEQTRAEATHFKREGDLLEWVGTPLETEQSFRRNSQEHQIFHDVLESGLSVSSNQSSSSHEAFEYEQDEARDDDLKLYIKHYPLARQVYALLRLSHGERFSLIDALRRGLRRAMKAEKEASESILFQDVEAWMKAHLSGGSAHLAKRLWEGSGRLLSPEEFESSWSLIEHYKLMQHNEDGLWRLTELGLQLLHQEHDDLASEPNLLRSIDLSEGLLSILMLCLEQTQLTIEELSEAWKTELRRLGKRRSKTWLIEATKSRVKHLADRGLLQKKQHFWQLSEEGLSWLRRGGVKAPSADQEALEQVWQALNQQRLLARESMAILLDQMDPLHFEALVCQLLEAMGYEDIYLTPSRHDMGVDVIGNIELGISSVREVIQVKRQHRAIHRPVLDALRGSLHRFDAVRGTLITTSSFSKGTSEAAFERGAAPITLIDGERLIDLLMKHEIGVKPVQVKLWQVDPTVFEEASEREWPRWRFGETE